LNPSVRKLFQRLKKPSQIYPGTKEQGKKGENRLSIAKAENHEKAKRAQNYFKNANFQGRL